jgi:hypothetical protein
MNLSLLFYDLNVIIAGYFTTRYHSGEDSSFGHNAITCLVVNGTLVVALFADLGDFKEYGSPHPKAASDGQTGQINTTGGDVFGKISEVDIKSFGLHALNIFRGQKTYLAVPGTGMRIPLDAVTFHQSDG